MVMDDINQKSLLSIKTLITHISISVYDSSQGIDFAQQVLENGANPRNGNKTDKAHPPIHPLKYTDNLQGNEKKIYEFIVRHFLACLSMDAQGHETIVEIDIADEKFSCQGLMIIARNYLKVYPYEKWNAKEVPLYHVGDEFEPVSIDMAAGETSPPSLLTEADLIALMDKHGIGTDATHADHIETIKSRMYVGMRPDGKIVPGQLGMGLVEGYDSMGFEMSKPHLRAELEADLKLISEGRKAKEDVLKAQVEKYKEVFIEACRQAQKLDEALAPYLGEAQAIPEGETEMNLSALTVIMHCPKCGKPMILRTKKEKKGFYVGCSGYPDCRGSIWLPDSVLDVKATDEVCSKCSPGNVLKLHFKFKRGSVPPSIPNDYIGCIGGCDEMLIESLGIRPIQKQQNQGNSNFLPYSQTTTLMPRNNPNSNAGSNRPGDKHNKTLLRGGNKESGSSSSHSNSFHTSTHTATPLRTQNKGNNEQKRKQPQTKPGSRLIGVSSTSFQHPPTPRSNFAATQQQRNNSNSSPSVFGSNSNNGLPNNGDRDIICNCGNNAILLTVRKEGPNTGRQFYKCSNQSGCNFFLWANEADDQQNQSSAASFRAVPNNSGFQRNAGGSRISLSDSFGDDDVKCNCGLPAKSLTVNKQGPNTGRPFHGCSKPREQSCNFFKWADESCSDSGSHGGFQIQPSNRGDSLNPFLPGNGNKNKTASKKSTSASSDGTSKPRKPPTCGYCGQIGHRKNKCPEKDDCF